MTGLRAVAAWLSLLGIAAYVRLSWVRCVSTVEGFDFADPDALYHLRQIRDGPMIRDWMLPDGLSPWPGGFDGVLAVLVRLGRLIGVRGTNAEEALVGTVLVLFSLWAVVLAWQVARASWGQAAGWIAALLVALIPAAIDRSRFGSIDHHLVEPIILLLALHPRLKARGRGIALGVGLVVSQSMMVAIGIAAVAMLAAKWRAREQELKVAEIATVALMVALPLVCVSAYAHGAWLDYRMVGLFQLGLLAVWALAAPIVDGPPARWRWQRAVGACVVLAALAAPLIRSASFLSRNRVVELAGESDSAFAASAFRLGYMTDLVWLWPVVLVWLGRRAWRSRNRSELELCAAAAMAAAAFCFQVRFSALAGVMLAVSMGGGLALAAHWLRRYLAVRATSTTATLLSAAAVGVVVLGSLRLYADQYAPNLLQPNCYRRPEKAVRLKLCSWLAENTPAHRGQADYRVLAPWWLGHHLIYRAERAPVTTPFIFEGSVGLSDSLAFYFSDDPQTAADRLRRLKVRYLVVPSLADLCRELEAASAALGQAPDDSPCSADRPTGMGWELHRKNTLSIDGLELVLRLDQGEFPTSRSLFRVFEVKETRPAH